MNQIRALPSEGPQPRDEDNSCGRYCHTGRRAQEGNQPAVAGEASCGSIPPITSCHIVALLIKAFVFCLPLECRFCDKGVLVHFVHCVSRTVPETQ